MSKTRPAALAAVALVVLGTGILLAQSDAAPQTCDLKAEQAALADKLADFPAAVDSNQDAALAALFEVGAAYQELATRCGYTPSQTERDALADYMLTLVDVPTILARTTVGTDVDKILAKLDGKHGDPNRGQLLYNGLEGVVDGTPLKCAACHVENHTAPPTEGTWTRIMDERLKDPALQGYDFERYVVESIVQPNAYIVPDYGPNLMPGNFGLRLDINQLADLIAFLESQDQ